MDRSELTELSKLKLFEGMTREELEEALTALHPREETYTRNQVILNVGDMVEDFSVVLSGSVRMEFIDSLGGRSIPAFHTPGQVFGVVAGVLDCPMAAAAVANEDCRVLLLDRSAVEAPRSHWRPWLYLLVRNLLTLSCQKYLLLMERDTLLAPKRARDRIIAYLGQIYRELGTLEFTIPFDQQQLADYLNLDRSVVSKELNKLKREGMLWFNRTRFILQPDTPITGEAPAGTKF